MELRKGQRCMLALKNLVTIKLAGGQSRSSINKELLALFPITFEEYLFMEQSGRTNKIMKGIDY